MPVIALLLVTFAFGLPARADLVECGERLESSEIEPMSLLTEEEQELVFEEFADFEARPVARPSVLLRRAFARVLDRARVRPLFTLGAKSEPDAAARSLFARSEEVKSECGLIEALDGAGNLLFRTAIVTSDRFAEVELGPATYALLGRVRESSAGAKVSVIRVRHTHPVVPFHRTSRFGWDDWLAAARFRVHADLILERPITLESEIVYRRDGVLEAKRFAIASERSILNGDYYDWASFDLARAAAAGPHYRVMMRRYFDHKKSDVEIQSPPLRQ